jgi:hypothetical protein
MIFQLVTPGLPAGRQIALEHAFSGMNRRIKPGDNQSVLRALEIWTQSER